MSGLENQQWYIEEIPATDPLDTQEEIVSVDVAADDGHPSAVSVETALENVGEPLIVLDTGSTALDTDQSKVGARKSQHIIPGMVKAAVGQDRIYSCKIHCMVYILHDPKKDLDFTSDAPSIKWGWCKVSDRVQQYSYSPGTLGGLAVIGRYSTTHTASAGGNKMLSMPPQYTVRSALVGAHIKMRDYAG